MESIIIKQPVISEKSVQLGSVNKYTFVVNSRSNTPEIKKHIEQLFKVKVKNVNTVNLPGKPKKTGRRKVYRSGSKKAIVTLFPGYSIKLFEESKSDKKAEVKKSTTKKASIKKEINASQKA